MFSDSDIIQLNECECGHFINIYLAKNTTKIRNIQSINAFRIPNFSFNPTSTSQQRMLKPLSGVKLNYKMRRYEPDNLLAKKRFYSLTL